MWFWIISSVAGSILGSAADSWFAETKLGIWFYKKVDQISSWAARKLNIKTDVFGTTLRLFTNSAYDIYRFTGHAARCEVRADCPL